MMYVLKRIRIRAARYEKKVFDVREKKHILSGRDIKDNGDVLLLLLRLGLLLLGLLGLLLSLLL